MKFFQLGFLFLAINFPINLVQAKDLQVFAYTPDYISKAQTIAIIKKSAIGRKWAVSAETEEQLALTLNHLDYRIKLILNFENQEIVYTDHTTVLLEEDDDGSGETWGPGKAPVKWLNNIRKDANVLFAAQSKTRNDRFRKLFSYTPAYISKNDAIDTLKFVSIARKWHITKQENDTLQIQLKHKGYNAILEFSFFGNEIRYDDTAGGYVPRGWFRNLKNDTYGTFPAIQKIQKGTGTLSGSANQTKITHGDAAVHFSQAPPTASAADIIDVLKFISTNREWVISSYENDILRISLDHNDYKAMLDFSISGSEILFTDGTRQYVDIDEGTETTKSKVPFNWLANLKNDAVLAFPFIISIKRRSEKLPTPVN